MCSLALVTNNNGSTPVIVEKKEPDDSLKRYGKKYQKSRSVVTNKSVDTYNEWNCKYVGS